MALGCVVCRGHLIAPSDYKHPETGKTLYSISELKPALTPPLFTTQKECLAYVREVEPYDVANRINAYGEKRKDFRHRRPTNRSGKIMEAYYGRTCSGYET